MKSILVIGIGRFGMHISKKLSELGNEVLAMDMSEERIRDVMPFVSNAQIGDYTKEDVLDSLGIDNFDICVVSLSDLSESLEVTYLLKSLGAQYVISRANHDLHEKLLLRSGADETVYPEREMGEKIAVKHTAVKMFDYIEVTPEHSISEIAIPKEWTGQSIEAVGVRKKYNVNILAYKQNEFFVESFLPTHVFEENEHIMVFGKKENIIKLSNKL